MSIMSEKAVAVDTGLILMVDPCYLFTDSEWRAICKKAHDVEPERPIEEVILEALKLKKKCEARTNAICMSTEHGDGRYEVERTDAGIVIRGA